MAEFTARSFDAPDETREFENGRVDVLHVADRLLARGTYQPGWRWSVSLGRGEPWCHLRHIGMAVSGRFAVLTDDGTQFEIGPGDVYEIPPGHDGWVIGDEPYVSIELNPDAIANVGL